MDVICIDCDSDDEKQSTADALLLLASGRECRFAAERLSQGKSIIDPSIRHSAWCRKHVAMLPTDLSDKQKATVDDLRTKLEKEVYCAEEKALAGKKVVVKFVQGEKWFYYEIDAAYMRRQVPLNDALALGLPPKVEFADRARKKHHDALQKHLVQIDLQAVFKDPATKHTLLTVVQWDTALFPFRFADVIEIE